MTDTDTVPAHVPRDLVVDFDVYAPAAPGEDFHAAWVRFQDEMRDRPLVWSPRYGGHWIVTQGRDVFDVYSAPARFPSASNTAPPATRRAPLGAIVLDPPDHAPFRAFLDAREYADPLWVDWNRPALATVTFGAGVHRCPGAPLGQGEITIFLEEWLPRIPDFAVDAASTVSVKGGIVATLDQLPLVWPNSPKTLGPGQ